MKNLKTLLMLGIFALVSMPLKAQPPPWPDLPPTGTPDDWDPGYEVGPGISFTTINLTGCDIDLRVYFNFDVFDGATHVTEQRHLDYPILHEDDGSISTTDLIELLFSTSLPDGNTYNIIGTSAWISFGGSDPIALIPTGATISVGGATAPCQCFHYEFDYTDPYEYKLIISPVSPCP